MATAARSRAPVVEQSLEQLLGRIVDPSRILTRPIDRVAFASDASFYRLIPRAVVLSSGIDEIQSLFRLSHEQRVPITFRAGGTSLSGQAVTDGILVEVARHWRRMSAVDGGRKVRVQPGVIGGKVNEFLRLYRAKIGPDPASINACMMGGILSNNSSGMCCGVANNAYHTLDSLTFVLPSGTVVDTSTADADEVFRAREPVLAEGLLQIRSEILANSTLRERIRRKYLLKNTTGYSLNAFIDFERPIDIFSHLLIGSEGTLAFIAEGVLRTVPDLPVKYTGLLLFPDLYAACDAIVPLRDAGAKALEIMDRASLRSVEGQPGIPESFSSLPETAAALLTEFQCVEEKDRGQLEDQARQGAANLKLLEPAAFTHNPVEQALLWKIRSGLFPSVAAVRRSGSSVIIEDVVFPVEQLAPASLDLTAIFRKTGYDDAIIFGHAKDGNLHFVIGQPFNTQAAVDQYARLMDEVVRLVVERYDGALKGEHGTGRNVAPFVEAEWGPEAYAIMKRVKALADPDNLLNPGVLINPNPAAHVSDLKAMPTVEEEVDKCMECGFCENKCPSRDLTLTPRQRIVVRREIVRLNNGGRREAAAELETDFPYMALDTCAADGLCATACPVSIDTGALTKRFRRLRHTAAEHRRALLAARHFNLLERGARLGLRLGRIGRMFGIGGRWTADLPGPAPAPPKTQAAAAQAVYFPSCVSRVMGGELMQTVVTVAQRAGVPVHIPRAARGACCGVPFSSKGYDAANELAVNRAIERLWEWSDHGRLPVVIDTSPCTYGLRTCRTHLTAENQKRFDQLRILDSVEFANDVLLPKLTITRPARSVALHPVCSLTKLNLAGKLESVARACSGTAVIPRSAGCCGFAGDRGFLFPELTAAATAPEAAEVLAGDFEAHYSSSRTCEIGLTRVTGRPYRSFIYLLEEATRPR
ncbi:MAG TPA: FAD-binding and (Fe-S)-binding domain-containing protein [Bryobacteraceae bacterium]|nr:FAD-binding and (Fe-S)-binding domain-containing protein [Bryobacteraceae bacterium]